MYLKYRPKTIAELDNTRVREIVTNVLSSPTIPHALLFIGQKGTGKTSTARIFAKTVNCLNNKFSPLLRRSSSEGGTKSLKSIEPCNTCANCMHIDSSSSPDVIELDAASNRGIEDIRNLIKEANFLPMSSRFRVFIIDEAHMITQDAFNALLKTLEEPPSSVIFILATTNADKIPKTISSRCSIINFGKAKPADIVAKLQKICKSEGIKAEEKLLSFISKHSEYSFRDAIKLLEELIIQNKLTYDEGVAFLGLLQQDFLKLVHSSELKTALQWLEEFTKSGGNIKYLIEQLLDELRIVLLAKNGVISDDEITVQFTTSDIVKLMKLLTEAYQNLKISPIESLPLEIAVVEFYNGRKSEARNTKS